MGIKILTSLILAICHVYGASSVELTVKNNCGFKIWPGSVTETGGAGPAIPTTGFELEPKASKTVTIPAPWEGKFWARYECSLSSAGKLTCLSGDCNSGQIECKGAGATPPASFAHFTIQGGQNNDEDFYDISLVDGFNLPLSVSPVGGKCPTRSCGADINRGCPNELAVKGPNGAVIGCKSACVAFNQPHYCCTNPFNSPTACKPTNYSQIFSSKCPQAYSLAYEDGKTTKCPTGPNYLITFCP